LNVASGDLYKKIAKFYQASARGESIFENPFYEISMEEEIEESYEKDMLYGCMP